jgi:AbrB family looped-hinge helix DNA binding protein
MPSSTLTSKGQITLPKLIRDHLHVAPGDRVDFLIDEAGIVTVRPARSRLAELQGMLHRPGRRAVTLEEMDEAIAREHSRRR